MTQRRMVRLILTTAFMCMIAMPAFAEKIVLTAFLQGTNEVPGIATGAFGYADIVVDTVTGDIVYAIRVYNLPSGVTVSHIHAGGPGVSGPVVINFAPPTNASNDFGFAGTVNVSQAVLRPDQGIRSPEDALQMVIGLNGYVNVHSTVNPGGEIRGQLQLKP